MFDPRPHRNDGLTNILGKTGPNCENNACVQKLILICNPKPNFLKTTCHACCTCPVIRIASVCEQVSTWRWQYLQSKYYQLHIVFNIRLEDCTTHVCVNGHIRIYHIEHICLCSTCASDVSGLESSTSINRFWQKEWRRSFRLSNYFIFCPSTKLLWLLTNMQYITKCLHAITSCCLGVVTSSDIIRLRIWPAKVFLDVPRNIL